MSDYCPSLKIRHNEFGINYTVVEEDKGSWFDWFVCTLRCANYDSGFKYDWKNDVCECKGTWQVPTIWRYKH